MEKTNRLREIALGVFMVFTISFSFILLTYSDGNGEVGVTDKVIKIGCHLDLSGAAVGWGAGESKGLKAYMNYLNDQGGIFGRKIEMIIEDDNYSPAKAVAATKKMIEQDKVFCFIGNLGSAPSLATYPIIEENKIPLLFAHNGANQHAYPPKKYDFALWTRYQDQMPILVDYAMKEFKMRKMGMIYQDDEAGKNCLDGTINGLKKYNLELVAAESHFRG
jgi:branched-chain amino acid transport system substrate-binding protein